MSNSSEFEDKAARLFNRLNAATQPRIVKNKPELAAKTASPLELQKVREEIETSDIQTRRKLRGLSENLRKLENSLLEESQSRAKMDETFTQTVLKLEKNMKSSLAAVQRSFHDKEKRLEEKIDALIRSQRKEIEGTLAQNQALIEQIANIDVRATALMTQISQMRRARLALEQTITRQFDNQLAELKRIFEKDIRERQVRQGRAHNSLKSLFKKATERILSQEKQREDSEKMLMAVVEQLVTHIIDA